MPGIKVQWKLNLFYSNDSNNLRTTSFEKIILESHVNEQAKTKSRS